MKGLLKNGFYVAILAAILFVVSLKYEGSPEPPLTIHGSSVLERINSVAEAADASAEEFARVSFVEYKAEEDIWEFSMQVHHGSRDVTGPFAKQFETYLAVLEIIIVESSKILAEKGGNISVVAVFNDLEIEIQSTKRPALVASDPQNWTVYLNRPEEARVMPESKFREILEEVLSEQEK